MRIVLISPFTVERNALHQLLVDEGHDVHAVPTVRQGLDVASVVRPTVVIADVQVIGLEGLELIRALAERGLQPQMILLSPRVSPLREDRVACLTKPIDLAQLRRHLADMPTKKAHAA